MLLIDILYILALVISVPVWIKVIIKKEYREILKYRLIPELKPCPRKRIWIHAVSVGEVRSLKVLLYQLKEKYPGVEMVLSVSTPAGYRYAKKEYESSPFTVINAPVDFSFTIKRFLRAINPQMLILNELEIWPNWIRIAHQNHIPIVVINGRMSELAFNRYKKIKFLMRTFLRRIDFFLVQAEIYKERFLQLGIPGENISVCGSMKADEAFDCIGKLPPEPDIYKELGLNLNGNGEENKKIITLASSHPEDEELMAPVIEKTGGDTRFIIVPRHLDRVAEIEKLLDHHHVKFSTWSKMNGNDRKVLIFDRMGYLFDILKITHIVFMGGTMNPKTGGHNLYEPAVLGKYIIGGPYYNNFPEIGEELVKRGVYHVVRDSKECMNRLAEWNTIDWNTVKAEGIDAVSAGRGSIQCILKEIQRISPPAAN